MSMMSAVADVRQGAVKWKGNNERRLNAFSSIIRVFQGVHHHYITGRLEGGHHFITGGLTQELSWWIFLNMVVICHLHV